MALHEGDPVRVDVRFERFPASVKGAFVMAGADGYPHAVRFDRVVVARIPSGPAKPIELEDRIVDVAPARDLFVPFEVPVTDLPASWYAISGQVEVDGARSWTFQGRPFSIPWSRGEVRRGSVPVHRRMAAGEAALDIQRVELGGEVAVVVWRRAEQVEKDGPEEGGGTGPQPMLLVDGEPLERLPSEAAGRRWEPSATGAGRSVFYPVPRAARSLRLVVRGADQEESRPLSLPLP